MGFFFHQQGGVQSKAQTNWQESGSEESPDGKRERRGKIPCGLSHFVILKHSATALLLLLLPKFSSSVVAV